MRSHLHLGLSKCLGLSVAILWAFKKETSFPQTMRVCFQIGTPKQWTFAGNLLQPPLSVEINWKNYTRCYTIKRRWSPLNSLQSCYLSFLGLSRSVKPRVSSLQPTRTTGAFEKALTEGHCGVWCRAYRLPTQNLSTRAGVIIFPATCFTCKVQLNVLISPGQTNKVLQHCTWFGEHPLWERFPCPVQHTTIITKSQARRAFSCISSSSISSITKAWDLVKAKWKLWICWKKYPFANWSCVSVSIDNVTLAAVAQL